MGASLSGWPPARLAALGAAILMIGAGAAPVRSAPGPTDGGLLGVSVLASDVGNRLSVSALTDFVTQAGLGLVVIDWAWVTHHWPETDFDAVNDLIASLSSRHVRVAAMYRPRFLGRVSVATQVNAEGKPAFSHGAEICYSDPEAREWGIARGLKILDKCPGFAEIIVYTPRNLCRCPACTQAAAGPGGRYGPVWGFLAEARSAWRAHRADVRLGVVGLTDRAFWEAGKSIVDVAYPFLCIRDDTDVTEQARAAAAVCDAVGGGSRTCLAKITWGPDEQASPPVLAAADAAARERHLQYVLWTMDTAFLSALYDPEVVAQAMGLDWSSLERATLGLRAERNAPPNAAGLPLLATIDPDRKDRRPVAGRYAVVTDLPPQDPYYAAAALLSEHRKAAITRVPSAPAEDLIAALQGLEAEQVAFVTRPGSIEPNLVATVFLASATMSHEVAPQFSYGFITGETAEDAVALVRRTIEAEREPPAPRKAVCIGHVFDKADHCYRGMESEAKGYAALGFATDTIRFDDDDERWEDRRLSELAKLDGATALVLCGHGSGDISCGLKGEDLARTRLNHAVVYNGSCWANATSMRWSQDERGRAKWDELPPGSSVVLGPIHAGAVGSIGSAITSGYVHVEPTLGETEAGASLGRATRMAQRAILREAGVSELRLRRGRRGGPSALGRGTQQECEAAWAAGLTLIGDPAYVPYPGGIPGAALRRHAAEGTVGTIPPLDPQTLILTAGRHQFVSPPPMAAPPR